MRILVRDGCQVFVELHGSLAESRIAEYVSGMTLAVVLQQRGALVLHASAVDLGGAVVAFTGPSGAGKSTTASVFAARGYPVVTDDFLPLHVNGSHVRCLGGTGTLKLLRRPPGPGNDVATAMDGKWLGACAADQKPGDVIMSNGVKVNVPDLQKRALAPDAATQSDK